MNLSGNAKPSDVVEALQTHPVRISSMDQFRGYTVIGMCIVNFLGNLAAIHPVLKHNNNYFSYADSIMPSFMFACGFSYRLSALRRLSQVGSSATYRRFISRSLGLVLVSVMMYGFGGDFKTWNDVTVTTLARFGFKLIKADLWETLAIIGVAQLLIMPVIAARVRTRVLTLICFLIIHLVISYLFNVDLLYGQPNALDRTLGILGSTAWDGGIFGLLVWGSMMLAGSLAYDAAYLVSPWRGASRLIAAGILMMSLGYGLSCLSMLYDGEKSRGNGNVAASPVWPPFERLSGRPLSSLIAEPPFVRPPPPQQRPNNYWMMHKKIVSWPFFFFSTGFAAALYGIFIFGCDNLGLAIGIFRTFGQNALAAYVLHHMVEEQILTLIPNDSPLWWCLVGLTAFCTVTYTFVRFLEKQRIFIRL